jgi:hypothetical protein
MPLAGLIVASDPPQSSASHEIRTADYVNGRFG